MTDRRKYLAAGALALALVAVQHPTANIKVLAHDRADPSPARVEAVVDLGLMAVSVLVTWSARRLTN